MTVYSEHELHTMAAKIRQDIRTPRWPPSVNRQVSDLADLLDSAAEGTTDQQTLRDAVDVANRVLENAVVRQ